MLKELQKFVKIYPLLYKHGFQKADRVNKAIKGQPMTAEEADNVLKARDFLITELKKLTKRGLTR